MGKNYLPVSIHCFYLYIHINVQRLGTMRWKKVIVASFLIVKVNSLQEAYIPKVNVAMLVYWMIWYCYCFLSGYKRTFSCIVQYSLNHNMDIGTMWHCTLVNSNTSQYIGQVFGCALFLCWVSLGAPVTIFLIEFYVIMIFIMMIVLSLGIIWP